MAKPQVDKSSHRGSSSFPHPSFGGYADPYGTYGRPRGSGGYSQVRILIL
jgi:hypothetical protein